MSNVKVVDVYDGDTCKIILQNDDKFVRYTCRLLGIDTPEIKGKTDGAYRAIDLDNRGTHSATTRLVQVCCHAFDKYGRLLVKLYAQGDDSSCLNDVLLGDNLAKSYDGGHKEGFD